MKNMLTFPAEYNDLFPGGKRKTGRTLCSYYQEDYTLPEEKNKVGMSLDHLSLKYPVQETSIKSFDEFNEQVDISDPKRYDEKSVKYIKEYYDLAPFTDEKYTQDWNDAFLRLPFEIIERSFTLDEIYQYYWYSVIMSEVSEEFDRNPYLFPLYKIKSSFWRSCYKLDDYNLGVQTYHQLKNFDLGLDDFEVKLDFSRYFNERGRSRFTETQLDSTMAYLIYYKGKHVLTLGFTPSCHGILLNQVQMKSKKGNRWAFKLPEDYFEFFIKKFCESWNGIDVHFITPQSAAELNYDSYGKDQKPSKDQLNYIRKTYSKELTTIKRQDDEKIGSLNYTLINAA